MCLNLQTTAESSKVLTLECLELLAMLIAVAAENS